jgi:putative transposase
VCWLAIPAHNPGVTLDESVIMPNHLHGLIVIHERQGASTDAHRRGVQLNAPALEDKEIEAEPRQTASPTDGAAGSSQASNVTGDFYAAISPKRGTLSVIVRTYKAAVTTACRAGGQAGFAWQRNYYEHVVRSTRELDAIRRYIQLNPLRWELDRDNPGNTRRLPPPVTIDDYLADLA